MPKDLDSRNLRLCLRGYRPDFISIRLVGSMGGTMKVSLHLREQKLNFKMQKSGLAMLVDSKEIFHFPLKNYQKGFSLAYERVEPTSDGTGRMLVLSQGTEPYDPSLPEPVRSILRTVLDDHLMEIAFLGRVHLKFHSWWQEPHWKYWIVEKNRC